MNETLRAALVAEGLDDAALDRVKAALDAEHLTVTVDWLTQQRLDREKAERERKASQAAGLAAAIPYAGGIVDCQAEVWPTGRGATAYRCQKRARLVVRREERFSGHRDRPKERVDGRLAVCRVHAADVHSHRHHGHWRYEVCAIEPVEPEYQP